MLLWLQNNLATILISAVILAVIAAIVLSMIKARKNGKPSCGCSCSGCSGCAHSASCGAQHK